MLTPAHSASGVSVPSQQDPGLSPVPRSAAQPPAQPAPDSEPKQPDLTKESQEIKQTFDKENISSEMLDRQEADKIAKELEMDVDKNAKGKPKTKAKEEVPEAPKPLPPPAKDGEFNSDDTIYIDRDGNLRMIDQKQP